MQSELLRVAIEAQIVSGTEGGGEQVVTGLCSGLESLRSNGEEYLVVGHWRGSVWRPQSGSAKIRSITSPAPRSQLVDTVKNCLGPLRRPLGRFKRWTLRQEPTGQPLDLPESDGFFESLNVDLLHVIYPLNFVRTSLPTILTMHDLQHRHFPEFFSNEGLAWREATYPKMFEAAKAIVTISEFCKADIIAQYRVPPEKIFVIPLAPQVSIKKSAQGNAESRVRKKYGIPGSFMLYPALTYAHKNHIRLLESLAILVAQGEDPPLLVCTGAKKLHWPMIERRIADLKLANRVLFTGFIPSDEIATLYSEALFVILPTLFEGAGLPLIEAFQAEKAVACADIMAFREYGGDAPVYFDPKDPKAVATAILRMSRDGSLRAASAARGAARSQKFSWTRAARMHRAVYRRVAGAELTVEEKEILACG